jgi:DNA-binding SARP family transcriptional activator
MEEDGRLCSLAFVTVTARNPVLASRRRGTGDGRSRAIAECVQPPADGPLTVETTPVPAGIERADTMKLIDQLDDVRHLVQARADAALSAVVVAADEVAALVNRHENYAEQCGDELRRALEAAAASRRRLELLLHLIHEFMGGSEEEEEEPSFAGRPPRRRWFGRERRRDPVTPPGSQLPAAPETLTPSETSSWPLRGDQQRRPLPFRDGAVDASDVVEGDHHDLDDDDSAPRPTHPPNDVDIAVHVLGPFRLALAGHVVETSNAGKSLRVLKYLLSHRDRPVPKDVLIDLFWPELDVDSAGRSLHQAIYTLRKTLRIGADDAQHVVFENGAYLINPKLSVWCDLDVFESSAEAGRVAEMEGRMVEAIADFSCAERCYRGDYLADSPYEEWAIGDRERLRLQYVDVANRLADLLFDSDDVDAAVAVSQKLLRHEPCDDATHRRLIRCYGLIGQRNLVIRQYLAYVACAKRLYGLGPSPETTALYRSLIAEGG